MKNQASIPSLLTVWPSQILFFAFGKVTIISGCQKSFLQFINMFGVNIFTVTYVIWFNVNKKSISPELSVAEKTFRFAGTFYQIGLAAICLISVVNFKAQKEVLQALNDQYQHLINDQPPKFIHRIRIYIISLFSCLVTAAIFVYYLVSCYSRCDWDRVLILVACKSGYLVSVLYLWFFQITLCHNLAHCQKLLQVSSQNLPKVSEIFMKIVEVNRKFNETYWLQILIVMTCNISGILCVGFRLGCNYVLGDFVFAGGKNDEIPILMMVAVIWPLCQIGSKKFHLVSDIVYQANKILLNSDNETKEKANELLSLASSLPLNISAGFFNINNSFFINCSGLILTYLVILVQFQISFQQPEANLNITRIGL